MSEREPLTLKFLARQQDRMLTELTGLRDDVNVLTAIVQGSTTVIPAAGRDPRDPQPRVGADWVTGAAVSRGHERQLRVTPPVRRCAW